MQTTAAVETERLARACAPRAWRLACGLMGHTADAEDVLQDAFIVAATRAHRIPCDDPWPWFATVVSNVARNARRKRARRASRTSVLEEADVGVEPVKELSSKLDEAALSKRVGEALGRLDEGDREALVLTHVSGLSLGLAAEALGLSKSTLQGRVTRGLERLRAQVGRTEAEVLAGLTALPVASLRSGAAEGWTQAAVTAAARGRAASTTALGLAAVALLAVGVGALALADDAPRAAANGPAPSATLPPADAPAPAAVSSIMPTPAQVAPAAPVRPAPVTDTSVEGLALEVAQGDDGRPRVTLRANGADVREVIAAVASWTDVSLTLSPRVRGTCRVAVQRVLAEEAIVAAARGTASPGDEAVDALVDAKHRHLYVATMSTFEEQRAVRAWPLVASTGSADDRARSRNALIDSVAGRLAPRLRGHCVEYDPATDTLFARGPELALVAIESELLAGQLRARAPAASPAGAKISLSHWKADSDVREILVAYGPALGKPVAISPNVRGTCGGRSLVHRDLPAEVSMRALVNGVGDYVVVETPTAWIVTSRDDFQYKPELQAWPLLVEPAVLWGEPSVLPVRMAARTSLERALDALVAPARGEGGPRAVRLDHAAGLVLVHADPVLAARLRAELAAAGLVTPQAPHAPRFDPPESWTTYVDANAPVILEMLAQERSAELRIAESFRGTFGGAWGPSDPFDAIVQVVVGTTGDYRVVRRDGVLHVRSTDEWIQEEPAETDRVRCASRSGESLAEVERFLVRVAGKPTDERGWHAVSRGENGFDLRLAPPVLDDVRAFLRAVDVPARREPPVGRWVLHALPGADDTLTLTASVVAAGWDLTPVGEVVVGPGRTAIIDVSGLRLEATLLDRETLEVSTWRDGVGPETRVWRVHPACWETKQTR